MEEGADGKLLPPELQNLIYRTTQGERHAETAYWWFHGIDSKTAKKHKVASQIRKALTLLHQVDNIALDIVITIKSLPNEQV